MRFIKRHKRAVLIFLAACVLIGTGTLYYLKTSKSEFAISFRAFVGEYINNTGFPRRPNLKKGLTITGETIYVDGAVGTLPESIAEHDVKVVYETPDGLMFCDYATGFSVSLPADMTADMSKSPMFTSFESPDAKLVISKEWTYDDDVSAYIGYYFKRFLLNDTFRAENDVALLENTITDDFERLTVRLNGYSGPFDTYTYLTIKTDSRFFFHVMLKYASGNQGAQSLPQRVLDSFKYFKGEGIPTYKTDYYPVIPDNWSAETRALYDNIVTTDNVIWGIYTHNILKDGLENKIPEIEAQLDYKFGLVLGYAGLDDAFPTDFMNKCADEGRIVELTLQATENLNTNLFGRSPWLTLYKTGDDARIRAFAQSARDFGKPFLIRLNNEMNSDWVSYGGVTNLLDPDIFVENWRTVYRIFQEEGVINAIWIFNPNDRDAPPNAWNCQAAYYPGNAFVQIFGVTGYNNGSYYKDVTGEYWREFDVIYDKVQEDSSALFGAFPWMITEFSSSSIGGDKVKWIDGMFDNIEKYPNIKAAVWFSSVDYDMFDGVTPARPYWLDETKDTLAAFKHGLEAG